MSLSEAKPVAREGSRGGREARPLPAQRNTAPSGITLWAGMRTYGAQSVVLSDDAEPMPSLTPTTSNRRQGQTFHLTSINQCSGPDAGGFVFNHSIYRPG